MNRLAVSLPGLDLKNPLMPASGSFAYGEKQSDYMDLNKIGAMVIKTTTLEPREGNKDPRMAPVTSGWLNAIGLQNPGIDEVVAEKLPYLEQFDIPVLGSVAGKTVEDFVVVAEKMAKAPNVTALELNVSCPNVAAGGKTFAEDEEAVAEVIRGVKAVVDVPVYVKLSPNVTDIVKIAKRCEAEGADGLTLINTVLGMRLNVPSGKPVLDNVTGGLSGKAIMPVAIRVVYQVARAVSIPIIGVGGIETTDDVLEFYLAGASAVQVGTAHFANKTVLIDLVDELEATLDKYEIESLESLRASVQEKIAEEKAGK